MIYFKKNGEKGLNRTAKILAMAGELNKTNNSLYEATNHPVIFLDEIPDLSRINESEIRVLYEEPTTSELREIEDQSTPIKLFENNQVQNESSKEENTFIKPIAELEHALVQNIDVELLNMNEMDENIMTEHDTYAKSYEHDSKQIESLKISEERRNENLSGELIEHGSEGILVENMDVGIFEKEEIVVENKQTHNETEEGNQKNIHFKRNIKRKKNLQSRTEKARLKAINKHNIQEGCKDNCKKKYNNYFSQEDRIFIHDKYWNLNWVEQRNFILNTCSRVPVKRRTVTDDSQRNMSFIYKLKNKAGKQITVCKTFFLSTLGYKRNTAQPWRKAVCAYFKNGRYDALVLNIISNNFLVTKFIKTFSVL